jgi:hypothetical protein
VLPGHKLTGPNTKKKKKEKKQEEEWMGHASVMTVKDTKQPDT